MDMLPEVLYPYWKRTVWKLHARSCFLDVSSVAESAAAAAWGQLLRLRWVSCCGCVVELECALMTAVH